MTRDGWYELHPPHLTNVATLPCESQKVIKVILHCDITKENCIKCIIQLHLNGPVDYKIWGVMQQYMHKTRIICDMYDLQKCLMQTWFDFEQNVIETAIDHYRDRLRSCVHAGGRNFYCGQTTGWIKIPLGMEVGLGLCPTWHCVRRGPSYPQKKGHTHSHPIFGPCLLWPNGWMDGWRRRLVRK